MRCKEWPLKSMTSSKGGDDEQSQVFATCCVRHVYAHTYTHGSEFSNSKQVMVTRKCSFLLNPKFRWSIAWPQTQSPVQVSTKRCDGRPTGTEESTSPSYSVYAVTVSRHRLSCLSLIDASVSKSCFLRVYLACQSILGQQPSYERNFWSVTLSMTSFLVDTQLLTSVTCSAVVTWCIMTSHATRVAWRLSLGKSVNGCDEKIVSSWWSTF